MGLALVMMRVALFYIAMIIMIFDTFIAVRFSGYFIIEKKYLVEYIP